MRTKFVLEESPNLLVLKESLRVLKHPIRPHLRSVCLVYISNNSHLSKSLFVNRFN